MLNKNVLSTVDLDKNVASMNGTGRDISLKRSPDVKALESTIIYDKITLISRVALPFDGILPQRYQTLRTYTDNNEF